MSIDLEKLGFYSEFAYLRTNPSWPPSVTATFGDPPSEVSVAHTANGQVFFVGAVDIFNDGVLWSNEYVGPYTGTSTSGGRVEPQLLVTADDNRVYVQLYRGDSNGSGTAIVTGSRLVKLGIYYDYTLGTI